MISEPQNDIFLKKVQGFGTNLMARSTWRVVIPSR